MEVASAQVKLDGRVNNLLRSAATAFSFAQDATLLNEGDDRLSSLRRTIIQLRDQLIECSLFIREYARQSLFSKKSFTRPRDGSSYLTTIIERVASQASDKRKVQDIEDALRTLQENLEKGVNFQMGLFVKDIAGAVRVIAKDDILRG